MYMCVLKQSTSTYQFNPMLSYLNTLPLLIPVPHLNKHIVGAGEDKRLRGVNSKAADVIGVRLKVVNLFQCIVVKHTNEHIILAHREGGGGGE